MSKFTAQQKRNRSNNSGGVALDATNLPIVLHRIHRKGDSETVHKRKVACFLI